MYCTPPNSIFITLVKEILEIEREILFYKNTNTDVEYDSLGNGYIVSRLINWRFIRNSITNYSVT